MKSFNISVTILCTNEKKYLNSNLTSLEKQTVRADNIYLLDNNSTDGSVEFVRNKFPRVKIIQNKQNLGFSKANNIGLRTAFKNKSDFCLLLNPDTVSEKTMIEELVSTYLRAKRTHYKIGLIQPVILLFQPKKTINTIGNTIHFLGYGYCRDYLKRYQPIKNDKKIVSVSGAAMLISKEFYDAVGELDEDFFMYNEDQDLSWRGLIKGYNHFLSVRSVVYHDYNFKRHGKKMLNAEKNRWVMILKNYSTKAIIILIPILILNEILITVYSLFAGWFFQKIKSYFDLIKTIKKTIIKRKLIQKNRLIPDRKIITQFASELEFRPLSDPIINNIVNPLYSFCSRIINRII